jgi:SMC interacting uncharacterized protein involved in chromosome segregation
MTQTDMAQTEAASPVHANGLDEELAEAKATIAERDGRIEDLEGDLEEANYDIEALEDEAKTKNSALALEVGALLAEINDRVPLRHSPARLRLQVEELCQRWGITRPW